MIDKVNVIQNKVYGIQAFIALLILTIIPTDQVYS
jgi:hypothetical protein